MYSFSDVSYMSLDNIRYNSDIKWVRNQYGTNRNIVAIKWQTPTNDDIVIKDIILEYYPIISTSAVQDHSALEVLNSNYPYSDTPERFVLYSTTETPDFAFTPYTDTLSNQKPRYLTNALISSLNTNNILLSAAGKYVVTRTYTDEFTNSSNQNGDTKERKFVYYVDRNTVLSEIYAKYGISYGYDTNEYANYPGYGKSYTEGKKGIQTGQYRPELSCFLRRRSRPPG